MVDKKQNKSYNVQLNYNLTKRTQHTQISAMTAYKIASVAMVDVTLIRPLNKSQGHSYWYHGTKMNDLDLCLEVV